MARRRCPQSPLCSYADPLVKDLRRLVPAALKEWDEEAIHDARVATRRLRAALDLIEPLIDDKGATQLRKTLRRLRRRLGPLRDLDVMLEQVRPYASHRKFGAGAKWLADQLRVERESARRKAQRKSPPAKWMDRLDEWQSLRRSVAALDDDVQRRLRASLQSQWGGFAAQADRLAAHWLDGDLQAEGAQDPHELRVAGKNLRYTLEMMATTRRRPPASVKRTFKRMQDELGHWHDHVVLAEAAMRQSLRGLLAHHAPELQAQVLQLAMAMLHAAERRLVRFARLWQEKGAPLASAMEGLDHDGAAVRAPRTDPDLFDSVPPQATEPPIPDESSTA